MEAWVWLTASLVGVALLQLVIYRFITRGESADERPAGNPGDHPGARADTGPDRPVEVRSDLRTDARQSGSPAEDEDIRCKHCGARNERESTFEYCRQCAQPLR